MIGTLLKIERMASRFYYHARRFGTAFALKASRVPLIGQFSFAFENLKLLSEKPVIIDIGAHTGQYADKIYSILIEVSFERLYENDTLYDGIICQLQSLGFELHYLAHFIRHLLQGRLLQADCLFINRCLKITG